MASDNVVCGVGNRREVVVVRWLGRAMLTLIILIGLFWLYQSSRPYWPQREQRTEVVERVERTPVFELSKERWTEFALPPQTDLVRVSSRLALVSEPDGDAVATDQANDQIDDQDGGEDNDKADREADVSYALEYQFINASDESVGQYHLRSRLPRTEEKRYQLGDDQGAELTRLRNFYLDPVAVGSDLLRLRIPADGPEHIVVEVNAKISRLGDETALLWQRLRGSVRRELSRASIAPLNLLGRDELNRLLRHGWQELGPEGVAGRDYDPAVVYGLPLQQVAVEQVAAGTPVGPGQSLSLKITEATEVRLQADTSDVGQLRVTLHLDDVPDEPHKVMLIGLVSDSASVPVGDLGHVAQWQGMLLPGVLEISASKPTRVQLFDALDNTPRPFEFGFAPHFLPSNDDPLRYPLAEAGTTLRVDVRALLSSAADAELAPTDLQQSVRYRWLDAQDRALATGNLSFEPSPSVVDRLRTPLAPEQLSQRSRYFLTAPAGAVALSVTAPTTALVAVANRPRRLPWLRVSDALPEQAAPAWFALYPSAENELIEADRRLLVRTQTRLPSPSDQNANADDRYQWQALRSVRPRPQQVLLNPAEIEQAGPTAFVRLRPGRNALTLARTARPQLAYLRDSDGPTKLYLRWNGGEVTRQVAGREGLIDLPQIAAGAHNFDLGVDDGRWWLNRVEPGLMSNTMPTDAVSNMSSNGASAGLRQRRVYELGQQPLLVQFEKRDRERAVINLEVYLQADSQADSQTRPGDAGVDSGIDPYQINQRPSLLVDIDLPAPREQSREHTLGHRQLLLAAPAEMAQSARLLFRDGEQVSASQRGIVVLGEDVPPGKYTMRLRWNGANHGYVLAYQLPRGAPVMSRYYSEELGQ